MASTCYTHFVDGEAMKLTSMKLKKRNFLRHLEEKKFPVKSKPAAMLVELEGRRSESTLKG